MTMALLVQAAGAAGVTAALAGMSQYVVNRRKLRRTRHLDSYGYVCGRPGARRIATMGCIVDETDQGPIHAAPNGRALCCDQALVCWPHPCPWHAPQDEHGCSETEYASIRERLRRARRAAEVEPKDHDGWVDGPAGDLCCTLGEDTNGQRHLPGCPWPMLPSPR